MRYTVKVTAKESSFKSDEFETDFNEFEAAKNVFCNQITKHGYTGPPSDYDFGDDGNHSYRKYEQLGWKVEFRKHGRL